MCEQLIIVIMWRTLLILPLLLINGINTYDIQYAEIELKKQPRWPRPGGDAELEPRSNYFQVNRRYLPSEEEETTSILEKQIHIEQHTMNEVTNFQPWSILWYVGSFGGLIAFFLVVSCSEWCCRARRRDRGDSHNLTLTTGGANETPPPAYDLFAPPSYESLCENAEKREYDVYVVPVASLMETDIVLQREDRSDTMPSPPAIHCANLRTENVIPTSNNSHNDNDVVLNLRMSDNILK